MGRHATLTRLRLRFFWPRMATFIATAISQCPDCILGNSTNRPSSSLLHGSVQDGPWSYVHLDVWIPGDTESFHGDQGILSAMDDLSSAVIVTTIQEHNSAHFGRRFLENVLLRTGITGVVVVDADSKFRDVFQQMCAALRIRWVPLARGNHKGLRVERFHRFLNKLVTAECRRRGTNQVFPETCHTAAYAWNSAPTDDSDITRSYVAFGLNFKFPMDVDLDHLQPLLGNESAAAIARYITQTDQSRQTSRLIVQWLTEDRRAIHREKVNANRRQVSFALGDCVSVRVQHQSNAAKDRVQKLEWSIRGPFEITQVLGHDAYEVRPLGRPDLATRRYKTDQLRHLPPSIQPCSPLDTVDYRYLNIDRPPILHPYRQTLGIDSYNHLWLDTPAPSTNTVGSDIDLPFSVSATNSHFPTIQALNDELQPEPDRPHDTHLPTNSAPSPLVPSTSQPTKPLDLLANDSLYQAISDSADKLFFIQYVPDGAMSPTLQLVQVNLDASRRSSETLNHRIDNKYYVDFLTRVSADTSKTFDNSRWRIIWHEYTTVNDEIEYSDKRVEFSAQKFPDPTRYIAYSDFIILNDPSVYLLGPFNFDDPGLTATGRSRGRERLPAATWPLLLDAIANTDLPPPPLSSSPPTPKNTTSPTSAKRPRLLR